MVRAVRGVVKDRVGRILLFKQLEKTNQRIKPIELKLLVYPLYPLISAESSFQAVGTALSIPMRIEHVALWTRDTATLERLREFYESWFGATAGPRYESRRRPGF